MPEGSSSAAPVTMPGPATVVAIESIETGQMRARRSQVSRSPRIRSKLICALLGHADIALLGSLVLPGRYAPLLLSVRATGDSGSMRTPVILRSGFVVRSVDCSLALPQAFQPCLDLLTDAFDLEWGVACQLTRLLFNGSRCFIYRTFYSVFVHWSPSGINSCSFD